MAIKLEINMTNKWLYSLIAIGVVLALGVGVYAYQSNMRAGNPPVMGHSAGELHVENSAGQIVSLQDALDNLAGSSGTKVIWEDSSIDGTQTGWECIHPSFDFCEERGCRLKMKSTKINSPNKDYIYTYSGVIDKNNNFFTFSSEADDSRRWAWWLNDNSHGGSWSHSGLIWLGDCRLTSGGLCSSILDEMNLCGYQGYKLEAILIKYD